MFMTNVGLKCFPAKRPTAKEAHETAQQHHSNLLHLPFANNRGTRSSTFAICH